jgi:hypothetical protein
MPIISLDRPSALRSISLSVIVASGGAWLGVSVQAATKPAAKAAASASAAMPQISVAGIRVIGNGLGANGSELHAFGDHPGTSVGLAIQAPEGSGIVEIDDNASRIDAFTDSKGRSLLEEGRFGSFPKISDDRAAAMVDVEVHGRPSAGASSVNVKGSVAMSLAGGSKPARIANVRLEAGRTMKLGNVTISLKSVTPGDESTDVSLALPRSLMNSIRAVRFFDSKGEPVETQRTSSGYINDAAEIGFDLKGKEKVVTAEFEVWQNIRQIKVPFNVSAGIALGGDSAPAAVATTPAGRSSTPADSPVRRNEVPTITPGPNEGAASADAALNQIHTALAAGKGRDLLALIYPDDRANFGVVIATTVVFSTLAHMDDPKAAEKAQKEVDALIVKHKLNMPLNKTPAEIFKNSDLAAFVTDAIAFLKTHLPKDKDVASAMLPPKGAKNITVDGDSAVAKMGNTDVKFVRVNNKWFMRVID